MGKTAQRGHWRWWRQRQGTLLASLAETRRVAASVFVAKRTNRTQQRTSFGTDKRWVGWIAQISHREINVEWREGLKSAHKETNWMDDVYLWQWNKTLFMEVRERKWSIQFDELTKLITYCCLISKNSLSHFQGSLYFSFDVQGVRDLEKPTIWPLNIENIEERRNIDSWFL